MVDAYWNFFLGGGLGENNWYWREKSTFAFFYHLCIHSKKHYWNPTRGQVFVFFRPLQVTERPYCAWGARVLSEGTRGSPSKEPSKVIFWNKNVFIFVKKIGYFLEEHDHQQLFVGIVLFLFQNALKLLCIIHSQGDEHFLFKALGEKVFKHTVVALRIT